MPLDNPLTSPSVVLRDTFTAELVPTCLVKSQDVALLGMQNKVYVSAGTAAVALGVQVKFSVVVVGVPEITGFPGADGPTAVKRIIQHRRKF